MSGVIGWSGNTTLDSLVATENRVKDRRNRVILRQDDRGPSHGLMSNRAITVWQDPSRLVERSRVRIAARPVTPADTMGSARYVQDVVVDAGGTVFAPNGRREATPRVHTSTYSDGRSYTARELSQQETLLAQAPPFQAATTDWAAAAPWLALLAGGGL